MTKNSRKMFVCLLFASLFFFFFAWLMQLYDNSQLEGIKASDSYVYEKHARNLYTQFKIHLNRPFGYAMFIGFPYLFGISGEFLTIWTFGLQFAAWLLTIVMIYKSITMLTGSQFPAIIGAILFPFCLGSLALSTVILTGTLYACFYSVFQFYTIRFVIQKKEFDGALAFFFLCFSSTIRPNFIHLIPFITLALIYYFFKRKYLTFKSIGLIVFSLVLLLVPMVSNKLKYDRFTFSHMGHKAIYEALLARTISLKTGINIVESKMIQADKLDAIIPRGLDAYDSLVMTDFKYHLSYNLPFVIKGYLLNLWKNTYASSHVLSHIKNQKNSSAFDFLDYKLAMVTKAQNLFLTLLLCLGFPVFLLLVRKKISQPQKLCMASLWFFSLYIFLISGVTMWGGDRFHLVFYPEALIGFVFMIYVFFNKNPIYLSAEKKIESFFSLLPGLKN